VYLAPRSIAAAYHLSLHESGEWHVGFSEEFKRELLEEGRWVGGSRLIAQFPKPAEIAPGTILGFRILIPASAVTIDSSNETHPTELVWIPSPPPDRAIEISVLILSPSVKLSGWPGRQAMETSLVGNFGLASGEHLWIVYRHAPIPAIAPMRGSVTKFIPHLDMSHPLENSRAVVLAEADGVPTALMECLVADKRFDPKVSA
jgi:hypothetical protein